MSAAPSNPKPRLKPHVTASSIALALTLSAIPARADLVLCNTTSSRIGVAIGF